MWITVMFWLITFFFNDTATTEIYTYGHTLSLHDALPISRPSPRVIAASSRTMVATGSAHGSAALTASRCRSASSRSEEHTSELQSLMRISYAVFCLKKKITNHENTVDDLQFTISPSTCRQ